MLMSGFGYVGSRVHAISAGTLRSAQVRQFFLQFAHLGDKAVPLFAQRPPLLNFAGRVAAGDEIMDVAPDALGQRIDLFGRQGRRNASATLWYPGAEPRINRAAAVARARSSSRS
jgi:hypothetical protein